jgi:hypothetical protein
MTIRRPLRARFHIAPIVVVTALAAMSPARAGFKEDPADGKVTIGNGYASGVVGAVRDSPDDISEIGCWTLGEPNWIATLCYAKDEWGQSRVCVDIDPNVAAVAASIKGDSYVEIHFDKNNQCTFLTVENGSSFFPKQP